MSAINTFLLSGEKLRGNVEEEIIVLYFVTGECADPK